MQSTEYRVESTESATAQSRGKGAECTMRAQCESTESARAHTSFVRSKKMRAAFPTHFMAHEPGNVRL